MMLRFGKIKVAREEFYGAMKLIEIKNNSKYLTGYVDDVIRPLVI